jgi:hypothetical protein
MALEFSEIHDALTVGNDAFPWPSMLHSKRTKG